MIWIWAAFVGFVWLLLALDLGVFHRKAHAVSVREALAWSVLWIALGLGFAGLVYAGAWCSPAMSSPCSVCGRCSLPWPECSGCFAT